MWGCAWRAGALLALCALTPAPAQAHLVGVEFGDFYAGALHLLVSPETVAALLALALVAAMHLREAARWMLLALPIGLLVGAAVGVTAPEIVPSAPLAGLSVAVAGLLGATALSLPRAALIALAAIIGAVHGYANGSALAEAELSAWLFASGIVAAGTVVGTWAIAVASTLVDRAAWVALAERAISSWLAAVGLLFFALTATAG